MLAKQNKQKIDSIEKLAQLVANGFADVDERFEQMDEHFVSLETEVRNGFEENRRILDRIETRLANLERAVFGSTTGEGGRMISDGILVRLAKLEKAVFRK